MAQPKATICVLTFGDYLPYFRRCLVSLLESTPIQDIELRLGFNCAPYSFYYALGRLSTGVTMPKAVRLPGGIERFEFSGVGEITIRMWKSALNLYKEPMCRFMYHQIPLETEYAVWLDDDSFVKPGWWEALTKVFDHGADYIGQQWWVNYLPGQTEMIKAQPWYRGVPFDSRDGKLGCWFMTGGFMALRSQCIQEVNFPDTEQTWNGDRLRQYGGDTLLGEIARQLSWKKVVHDEGILVNVDFEGRHPAPRRGGAGKQFGSEVDIAMK